MIEGKILNAQCTCGHAWRPYGETYMIIPHEDTITCPECQRKFGYEWLDAETKRKVIEKKRGLLNTSELLTKINDLETKVSILSQELEIEKSKRELHEDIIKKIDSWAKDREQDFKDIELLVEEEKEREAGNADLI